MVSDPDLVPRQRLLDLLTPAPDTRITVLRAPAGYGKTVTASRWASRSDRPVAWVSFRPTDDERAVTARLGALPAELEGTTLVLDAMDAPGRSLVVDLERWVAGLPPTVRTVITRRSRPGPDLAGVPGGMTTVGAADLAFTPDEIGAVVSRMAGVVLDDRQLERLMGRSEGWPFAVEVVATALRTQSHVDTVLGRLHGGDRQIAAMFHAEVLDRLPRRVRRFLLRTSVLEQLEAGLCASLAHEPRSEQILRDLERSGAFTEAVPGRRGRHRYHPLFREYLRTQLRVTEPGAESRLLLQSAEWYAQRGRPEEVPRYALEADEPDWLVGLVDRFTRTQFERGDPATMLEILDVLPDQDRPDVALRRAYLLTMLGETRRAAHVLRHAEGTLVTTGMRAASRALRATWIFFDAAPEPSIDAADQTLALLEAADPDSVPNLLGLTSPAQLEAMALGSRARARWCAGELEPSREELRALLATPGLYPPWHVHALSAAALLESWSGNLRAALELGRRSAVLAGRHGLLDHPATLDAYLAVAHALRERNDLERSDRMLRAIEGRLPRSRRPTTTAVHAVERASWWHAAGRSDRGLAVLREQRLSGEPPPPALVAERLRAVHVRLLLDRGDLPRADAATRSVETPIDADLAAAAVHVAVARGALDEARERLNVWRNRPTDVAGRIGRELWTAIVAMESGDRPRAFTRLDRAVTSAAPDSHRRVFLETGDPGARLLRAHLRARPTRVVQELLAAGDAHSGRHGGDAGLSERELEILRYLPTDLSSADIADRLYISPNTLKTHLRTIYRKLEVGGRRQAVEQAEALGIA